MAQPPASPWKSVLAGATSLEQVSEADGLTEEMRRELREQARAKVATARAMQATEADWACEGTKPETDGPTDGPPGRGAFERALRTAADAASRLRSRFESADGSGAVTERVEADVCRVVGWAVRAAGERQVIVEDSQGRQRELA